MEKLTLSVPEMGEMLGISRPKAYEIIKKEGFPVIRITEKRLIIPKAALEKWLNEQPFGITESIL